MEMTNMIPQYSTITFSDIWPDYSSFANDMTDSPFKDILLEKRELLFYLLYSRYGNNPIANRDITQWKFKMFSVIFQYGPTWEKRLDIQEKLRNLGDEDLLRGSKAIYNHSLNPSTLPSTSSTEELNYINDQSINTYKKSKMDAYMQLWNLLKVDVTEDFLNAFKKCFKIFVSPEQPLLYTEEDLDD